jgi:hypothetical protein
MFKVEVRGGTKEQRAYVRSIARFSAYKLMSKRLADTLSVKIKLKKELMANEGMYGDVVDDDSFNRRPKEFVMNADADMSMRSLLTTVAHEMVHVKQYATDEMREVTHAGYRVVRFKKEYFPNNMEYYLQPWEIEAQGWEKSLFELWATAEGIYEKIKENPWAFDAPNHYPAGYWDKK